MNPIKNKFDFIRNKITLSLTVFEKLSAGQDVNKETISLAHKNLSEIKEVLDNEPDCS